MILKPSLSFAGPREYRWQGLDKPIRLGDDTDFADLTQYVHVGGLLLCARK
jgi:hypothetical protein